MSEENKTHPLVKLAQDAVEAYITQRKIIEPKTLVEEMKGKAGVFVSIKKHGELRGCIGTFEPTRPDIAHEIITNAISAATRDPRFEPVDTEELEDLQYSVDILTTPEPVQSIDELDPIHYGLIVESGIRRGLLLPDLYGVSTVDEQIRICKMKAGISYDEPVNLYRFQVRRYK